MKPNNIILKKVESLADSQDKEDILNAWFYFLKSELEFPFKAEIELFS